jgi:uncharacterized protein (TIGR02646 family)
MIRIRKPRKAPEILRTKGKAKRKELCKAYLASPDDYRTGKRKPEFDSGIYGSRSVKRALIKAQHGKCAFCESKITHIAYGDVEHFRPKAGVRQKASDKLQRPGYYWLAYEWRNLLLSCQLCNQRYKENLFPLEDPIQRARSHTDKVSKERPLFIDPSRETDPEALISFHDEVPCAVDGNLRARRTIESLALDRDELNEMRLQWLSPLRVLRDIITLAASRPHDGELKAHAAEARAILRGARRDEAQYAGMVRAVFGADL